MSLYEQAVESYVLAPIPSERVTIHYTDTLIDLYPELLGKDVHYHDWRVTEVFDPTSALVLNSNYVVYCTTCDETHNRSIPHSDLIRL